MIRPASEIVPATDDDIARFYGGIEFTGKWFAKAMRRGSLVSGFGGMIETEDGVWFAFLEVPAHERKPILYRHIRDAFDRVKGQGAKVIKATCDTTIPNAEKLMVRLGFRPTDEELNGKVVWVCPVSE